MTTPTNGTSPRPEHERVRSSRPAWAGTIVALVAIGLIGIPLAYRVATAPPSGSPPAVLASPASPDTSPPSPGASPPEPAATGLSDTDRAVERVLVAHLLGALVGPGGCGVERIPLTVDRSVSLRGRVDARDHAGWVFSCPGEAGDRTRYFRLVSAVAAELRDIGVEFQGGLSYVGDPGKTLETRWIVSGDVLSGEIEMLATPTSASTLTIVVLLDLRGSWQGGPQPS